MRTITVYVLYVYVCTVVGARAVVVSLRVNVMCNHPICHVSVCMREEKSFCNEWTALHTHTHLMSIRIDLAAMGHRANVCLGRNRDSLLISL